MNWQNFLLLVGVIVLGIIPFFIIEPPKEGEETFAGADGQAEVLITEIQPDYKPWFEPFWTPPSGEIESLLFGLQSALGAALIAYCLGYYGGRQKARPPQC